MTEINRPSSSPPSLGATRGSVSSGSPSSWLSSAFGLLESAFAPRRSASCSPRVERLVTGPAPWKSVTSHRPAGELNHGFIETCTPANFQTAQRVSYHALLENRGRVWGVVQATGSGQIDEEAIDDLFDAERRAQPDLPFEEIVRTVSERLRSQGDSSLFCYCPPKSNQAYTVVTGGACATLYHKDEQGAWVNTPVGSEGVVGLARGDWFVLNPSASDQPAIDEAVQEVDDVWELYDRVDDRAAAVVLHVN